MNLAVSGVSGYFPDNVGNKLSRDASPYLVNEFWDQCSSQWGLTWDGEGAAMEVDSV